MSFPGARRPVIIEGSAGEERFGLPERAEYIVLESITLNGSAYKGDGELRLKPAGSSNEGDVRRFTSGDAWPVDPTNDYIADLDGDTLLAGDTLQANFITFVNIGNVPRLIGSAVRGKAAPYSADEFDGEDLTTSAYEVTLNVERTDSIRVGAEDSGAGTWDLKVVWEDPDGTVLYSQTILTGKNSDFAIIATKGRRARVRLENNSAATDVSGVIVTYA